MEISKELREKFSKIKMLAMDFDGVHTDGRVFVDQDGRETVVCSRRDGMGLEMLRRKSDVKACVISKEANPVVSARCKKLELPCVQKVDTSEGKLDILKRFMAKHGLAPEEVIYMGDDVVDIAPMQYAGIGIAVGDAWPKTKEVAQYVTSAPGGRGAVREVCEIVLKAKGVEIKF